MSLSASERSFVKGLRMFRGFSDEEKSEVASRFASISMEHGETLFSSGDDAMSCYVLLKGEMDIWLDQEHIHEKVAKVLPGDIFGHIALLDGGQRSAMCKAARASVVLELSMFDFADLMSPTKPLGFKLLRALTEIVVNQMRTTNDVLTRLAVKEQASSRPRPPTNPDLIQSIQEAAGMTVASHVGGIDLDDVEVVVSDADRHRQYNRKG